MNCKDFENMIHELVSRRAADKTKQLEALEHAGHCLWCAMRLDEETKLTETLQAFAGTLQGRRAPPRVEAELLQAFRERTSRTSSPRFGLGGKRLWRGLGWGLAFAATLAAVWIIVLQWPRLHPRSGDSPSQVANNRPLAPSEASQANVAPVPRTVGTAGVALKGGATRRAAPHWSPERAVRDESASEVTTDFIPLGTCDDSQCMDDATLVRVSLPAEALLAFGLGTDNDFPTEGFVQADVALGSDGLPFAIRFVD